MTEELRRETMDALSRFYRLYSEKIMRPMAQAHREEFTKMEFLVMSIISESDSISTSELVLRAQMPKQQVSQVVNELEKNGMVIRTRSNLDRRVVNLSLTEHAREMFKTYADAACEQTVASLVKCGAEIEAEFAKCLTRLNDIIAMFETKK
ncbi:MAG: MarR family transcriptional regulator [Clostridia bacterium]|nr:MarR family transcriptional regulator [Clostridia bacterium]